MIFLGAPLMIVAAADARAAMPRPADILAAVRRVADWQIAHRDTVGVMLNRRRVERAQSS